MLRLTLRHSSVDRDLPEGLSAKTASHRLAPLKLMFNSFVELDQQRSRRKGLATMFCAELLSFRALLFCAVVAEPLPPSLSLRRHNTGLGGVWM